MKLPNWLRTSTTSWPVVAISMPGTQDRSAVHACVVSLCLCVFNPSPPPLYSQQQPGDPSVNHPNQYFIESRDILAPSASKPSVQYEEQQ